MTDKRKRVVLRILGFLFLLIGIGVAIVWFYFLGPFRNVIDPSWHEGHSEKRVWEEVQRSVSRLRWAHDDFGSIGRLGDKSWVARIMKDMKPGNDISSCAAAHKDEALKMMTNQDAGESTQAWLDWWTKNQSKSQEEWIREGFKVRGIDLKSPLSKQNIQDLLRIIAQNTVKHPPDGHQRSRALHWNAMRWLRDTDFDPATFSHSDLPKDNPDEVIHGLVEYSKLIGHHRKYLGIGVLHLGKPVEAYEEPLPRILTPIFRSSVYCLLLILLGGGVACVFYGFKKK